MDMEHFFQSRNTSDGYHSWCKSCCQTANKASVIKRYSTFSGRTKTFLISCRKSAGKRGQQFLLTESLLLKMWEDQNGLCAYSGIPMDLAPNKLTTVSVERIDSGIGYTEDNTVFVCTGVNRMKSDLPAEDFYNFCRCVTLWLSDDSLNLGVRFSKHG